MGSGRFVYLTTPLNGCEGQAVTHFSLGSSLLFPREVGLVRLGNLDTPRGRKILPIWGGGTREVEALGGIRRSDPGPNLLASAGATASTVPEERDDLAGTSADN